MPLFLSILTMKYEVGMEIMTKITRCPDNTRDHPNKQAALCLAADPTRPLYLRDANYLCLYLNIKANPTAIPVISTYISYRIPISNESC